MTAPESLPARYLRQWTHENVFPTQTDRPFPECLKALGLHDPRLSGKASGHGAAAPVAYTGKLLPGVKATVREARRERLTGRFILTAMLVITTLMTTALIVIALG